MQLSLFYFSFRASTVTVPLIFAWDRWDISDMMQHATDLLQSYEETSNRSYLGAVREAAKEHIATNAISSDELRKMFVQFNLVTNIMNALSKSFNFCSTGVCLLAMTVERYIFICHAMKADVWLSKGRHTLLCVFSSTAILVGSTVTSLRELFSGNLTCELCEYSNQRLFMMWRIVETIIFFVTPASFCVFLHKDCFFFEEHADASRTQSASHQSSSSDLLFLDTSVVAQSHFRLRSSLQS